MKLMPGADVWFHPGAHELQLLSNQPLAAKVTYVHHSGLVNLIVWGKAGETFQRASVPFWGAECGADGAPNRMEGESYEDWQKRDANWRKSGRKSPDRPTTNHASWISEDTFDVPDAPYVAAVARHPFEGRPSGGVEDLERARSMQSAAQPVYDRPASDLLWPTQGREAAAIKREPAESEAAYKARVEAWQSERHPRVQAAAIQTGEPFGPEMPARGFSENEDAYKARLAEWQRSHDDPAKQADGQAKSNADHGPPRSFGQSPNSGGPLAIDDHEPKPEALTPSSPFQGSRMRDRDAESPPPPAAFATPRPKEAEADKAKPDDAKANADKQAAADENQQKADKSAKDKKAADKSP